MAPRGDDVPSTTTPELATRYAAVEREGEEKEEEEEEEEPGEGGWKRKNSQMRKR